MSQFGRTRHPRHSSPLPYWHRSVDSAGGRVQGSRPVATRAQALLPPLLLRWSCERGTSTHDTCALEPVCRVTPGTMSLEFVPGVCPRLDSAIKRQCISTGLAGSHHRRGLGR